MAQQEKQESDPRRLRWSVPRADVSTNRWLDLQENISRSLQLLIREAIEREGYVDVVNKPIEQLPRRGRPPGSSSAQPSDSDVDADQVEQEPVSAVSAPVAKQAVNEPAEAAEESDSSTVEKKSAKPAVAQAEKKAAPAPEPEASNDEPAQSDSQPDASGQFDMDDIFGHSA